MIGTVDPNERRRFVKIILVLFVFALIMTASTTYLGLVVVRGANIQTQTETQTQTQTVTSRIYHTTTSYTTAYTTSSRSISTLAFPVYGNVTWSGVASFDSAKLLALFPQNASLSIPINNHNFILTPLNGTLTRFEASTYITQNNKTLLTTISGRAVIEGAFAVRIDGNESTNIGNQFVHGIDYTTGTTTITYLAIFNPKEDVDSSDTPLWISVDFNGTSEYHSETFPIVLRTTTFHWSGQLPAKFYIDSFNWFTNFLQNHD